MRNTGTAASSGTTQVDFDVKESTGDLQAATGTGWSCSYAGFGETCTNTASVPAGGSLPPLQFPFASLPGYGFALATAALSRCGGPRGQLARRRRRGPEGLSAAGGAQARNVSP